jgi:type IV secretory pathway TraG/TraD family ATPase VirD4
MFGYDIQTIAEKWDVKYGFTRPANFQHLSSYQTFLRLAKDYSIILFYLVLAVASTGLLIYSISILWYSGIFEESNYPLFVGSFFGLVLIWAGFTADYKSIFWAYRKELQRETHGSSKWADEEHLKSQKLIAKTGQIPKGSIAVARYKNDYELVLPMDVMAQSVVLIGPPKSGKTATIILNVIRQFAQYGGMLAIDPKGELFEYSAYEYNNYYRLDLKDPEFSDYFDLFGACRGNPTLAGKVAHYLMSSSGKAKDPIWEMAATGMTKALILHLCEIFKHPTPQTIYRFLEANPAKAKKRVNMETGADEWYYPLHEALSNSPSEEACITWGASFSQIAKETFGSVIFQMFSNLEIFTDPKVQAVLRPPTADEKSSGRRTINFHELRKKFKKDGRETGTAIYVVVQEGEMERLKRVISAFLAIADDVLRETGGDEDDIVPVLTMYEEAGNCPPPGLQEKVNVGRGRKMYNFICLQNKSQLEDAYGEKAAKAIMESVGTLMFLPGMKGDNADFAVRLIGRTTVLQKSVRDAQANAFDSENASETGRNLMDADELRRLKWFNQLIVINNDSLPIRARFSENQKIVDARQATPIRKTILTLEGKDEKLIKEVAENVNHIQINPGVFQRAIGDLTKQKLIAQNSSVSPVAIAENDPEVIQGVVDDTEGNASELFGLPEVPDDESGDDSHSVMTNQSNFADGTQVEGDQTVIRRY